MNRGTVKTILAVIAIVCGSLALVGAKAFGATTDDFLSVGLISAGIAILL